MDADLLSIADARECARRSKAAFQHYRRFDQAQVDRITLAAVEAAHAEAERLARLAVDESGIGCVEGKTAKNRFASRGLWRAAASLRTCGIVNEDPLRGIWEVADPFGVVAAIIPTTNPTSTAIFKAVCCLKSRNAMVASPHPRARRSIRESIRVCHDAAVEAGAPRDILTCMEHVSLEGTQALMKDPDVALILATGGGGLVRAAYSSGKPAFGVGPGNVPVFIHRSADVEEAARCIVESQTFDHGTICSSEQALIADRPVAAALRTALIEAGAHFCSPEEKRALESIAIRKGVTNPDIVGQSAPRVAEMAGFQVPAETTVLVAPHENSEVGRDHPLSLEKLCPLLSWYEVSEWEEGCRLALAILDLGGRGHTMGLHCRDEAVIRAFALEKPVNRLIVNSPTSQGAVGFSTGLFPSMTLGCGSFGGNITSDNVGPQHLLNIKRVAWVRPTWREDRGQSLLEPTKASSKGPGRPVSSPWESSRATSPAAGASRSRNPAARVPVGERAPIMGVSRSPLPGEHFSDDDLERIAQEALLRRRPGGRMT